MCSSWIEGGLGPDGGQGECEVGSGSQTRGGVLVYKYISWKNLAHTWGWKVIWSTFNKGSSEKARMLQELKWELGLWGLSCSTMTPLSLLSSVSGGVRKVFSAFFPLWIQYPDGMFPKQTCHPLSQRLYAFPFLIRKLKLTEVVLFG